MAIPTEVVMGVDEDPTLSLWSLSVLLSLYSPSAVAPTQPCPHTQTHWLK